jgi:hypothetical protein
MDENLTTVDAQLEKIANILQEILEILGGQ